MGENANIQTNITVFNMIFKTYLFKIIFIEYLYIFLSFTDTEPMRGNANMQTRVSVLQY